MTPNVPEQNEMIHNPGIFELPTPEKIQLDSTNPRDNGASLSTWDDDHVAEDVLPMIVWLRGDEPWFTAFDMDAEAVMQALGIKRSRLTQISGRDLRVGRVRMDRYIRPVYRSLDVEQYLKWTRATASHQKSSDAIKIAVDELQEQSSRIQTTLDSITSAFTESIKKEMADFIAETVSQGVTPLLGTIESFQSNMTGLVHEMGSKINASTDLLKTTADKMRATLDDTMRHQAAAFEILTLQLNQTSEKAAIMEERLAAWDNLLTDNLKTIKADLAALKLPAQFKKALGRKPKGHTATPNENSGITKSPKLSLRSAPSRRKPK